MASPFYLFRKYQKTFLVIAGVLAMFIFVVADPLMQYLQSSNGGGGQQSAGTVVATWDGGSMNVQQLNQLAQRRIKISDFLRGLYIDAATMIQQEGGTPVPPTMPNFIFENNDYKSIQVGCVTTRVLAELAEKSDISVSNEVVNHYIREWGLRRMGDAEISRLLGRVGMSDKTLFAGIRELLLGDFYVNSYHLATRGVVPEERWQDWKRINERIAVEAAILPAKKFLAEVPEPDEAQLKAFYELHKDRIGGTPDAVMGKQLPSPDPGFREPRRVKLHYLLGSVNEWTHKLLDTVSEAEIADYYERNKRSQFTKTSTSSATGLFDEEESPSEEPNEESSEEPVDNPSPDEKKDAKEPSGETQADEEQPADDESSRLPGPSPFRLAAFQEDAEAEAEESETASEESPKEEPATEAPLEYVPLEEVREQIQRSLATDKAVEELQKVVDQTYASLQSAYNPYGYKVVTALEKNQEAPAPPAKLSDFKAIATATGLASEETVLLSNRALSEAFVGKARDSQSRREPVYYAMFDDQGLFEPFRAIDLDGNWYLVSKVEDVPSRVPEFDEVRDAVAAAWKNQEAAKLALAKANELAKLADDGTDTLATVARGQGYEVVTTDMFSWQSFGATSMSGQDAPRLGEAPPLKAVDFEFMTKAFDLEPEQNIGLLNHDQTDAYVLHLARREQTEAEMRQQFLAEANNWFGRYAMTRVRVVTAHRILEAELRKKAGLNWDKLLEILSKDPR